MKMYSDFKPGETLNKIDEENLTFVHFSFNVNEYVGVPRKGEKFDYGLIVKMTSKTVVLIVGIDPVLKKELPIEFVGKINFEFKSLEEKLNHVKYSMQKLHELSRITSNEKLKSSSIIQDSLSLIQLNINRVLYKIAASLVKEKEYKPEKIEVCEQNLGNEVINMQAEDNVLQIKSFQNYEKQIRRNLLKKIIFAERKSAILQSEALAKLAKATQVKFDTLYELTLNNDIQ